MPVTTAADEIHKYISIVFQRKEDLILSESSTGQRIHMKNQALFSSVTTVANDIHKYFFIVFQRK